MSLQVVYSFDHIQSADIITLPKIVSISSAVNPNLSIGGGRDGTNALALNGGNIGEYLTIALDTPYNIVTIGAWIVAQTVNGNQGEFIALGHPDITNAPFLHTSLTGRLDGSLGIHRGGSNSGTLLGQSVAGVFQIGVPFYVEWQSQIGVTGSSSVRVNEVEVLHLNNINNSMTSDTTAKFVALAAGLFGSYRFDDMYIATGEDTGDGWTGFRGIVKVNAKLVNGLGDLNQWAPSTPTGVNWQNVDENVPSVVDFNDAASVGLIDTYQIEDTVLDPIAVQVDLYAKKLGAGASSIAHVARISGTNHISVEISAMGDAFKYYKKAYGVQPTGSPWTAAIFNALQVGPQRVV